MIRHLDTLRRVNLAQSLQELFVALRLIEFPGHQLAAVPQGIDNVHGQHDVIQRTFFQGGGAVTHAATASALPSSARRAMRRLPSSTASRISLAFAVLCTRISSMISRDRVW